MIPDGHLTVFRAAVPVLTLISQAVDDWRDDMHTDQDQFDPQVAEELQILQSLLLGALSRMTGLVDADRLDRESGVPF